MMQIVVGSTALAEYNMSPRQARDIDTWFDAESTFVQSKAFDSHYMPNDILKDVPVDRYAIYPYIAAYCATPDAIYTIKCSHASWDIKWTKTVQDIMYLKSKGCRLIPDLYWKLYEYWKTVHGNKDFLSLKKTKDDFFDDYVPHKFDHDWLHEVVACSSIEQVRTLARLKEGSIDGLTCLESGQATPNRPVYTKVLKDNEEVLLDHAKFLRLSYEEQVRLFREEIKVIALERYLIPSNFVIGQYKAYLMAMKKTITNLTKNWATLFILDNLSDFCIMGDVKWYTNFINLKGDIMQSTAQNQAQSLSEEIQEKLSLLNIEKEVIGEYEVVSLLTGTDAYSDVEKEFLKWLEDTYDFKYVDGDDSGEGEGEYCYAVFELHGQLYKAEYSYYSFDGHNYENFWEWTPVEAKQKTITVYE